MVFVMAWSYIAAALVVVHLVDQAGLERVSSFPLVEWQLSNSMISCILSVGVKCSRSPWQTTLFCLRVFSTFGFAFSLIRCLNSASWWNHCWKRRSFTPKACSCAEWYLETYPFAEISPFQFAKISNMSKPKLRRLRIQIWWNEVCRGGEEIYIGWRLR